MSFIGLVDFHMLICTCEEKTYVQESWELSAPQGEPFSESMAGPCLDEGSIQEGSSLCLDEGSEPSSGSGLRRGPSGDVLEKWPGFN